MQQRKNIKLIQLIDQKTGQTEPYILQMDLVGKGYYGSVYKAVHQNNPSKVYAVKVITLKRQQTREQILKQLQIIQKIPKSPNLVDTHKQHLQSKNHLYIFQEFCEGGSLAEFKQKMQGRLIQEQFAFNLFYQLGRGYLDLYQAGIIHQDIKPSNILMKGRLFKYCDFGVSQLANNLKYEESRKGTVSYMPPEKLLSKFKPSARSDIFSLGVTLYEIIFGFHPYLKKKTKNTKEYLTILYSAQLAPSHQLLRRIQNPSLKMNKLINFIEGMICRKQQLRMSIQELQDILFNQQPFKSMRLPEQQEISNEEHSTGPPKQAQQSFQKNNYQKLEIYPYINQSKVFVINNKDNTTDCEEENRLFQNNIEVESSPKCKKSRLQAQKLTKIHEEEEKKALENLFKEYQCIKDVINYLDAGMKIVKEVFNQIEPINQCGKLYFTEAPFSDIQTLRKQSPCDIVNFIVLRMNVELMSMFSRSIQNFEKFYQKVPILQQVEYLEAEVSKFIADSKNIKEKEVKKWLVGTCRDMGLGQLSEISVTQFRNLFENMVKENSVRVNFKQDLMNAIFLLHVRQVISLIKQLPSLVSQNQQQGISQIKNGQASFSSLTENNQNHNNSQQLLTIQSISNITSKFNQYNTLKRQKLKEQALKQLTSVQGIMYDTEENNQEFQVLCLEQYIDCEEEEREEGRLQGQEIQRVVSISGERNKDSY